jgi:hypothetical protein
MGVWTAFQDRYLRLMKDKELPLILGGDGRADTPGHSAKNGSYATIFTGLLHQHQVALQDTACCRIFSMSMNTC